MNITQLDTVDPNVAVIDTNVRRNAAADKDLVSSIKQHGILQPPVGWRDQDGIVHITMGQRRTLAARAAGLTEIPVIIQDQAEAETARIVAQLAENDHRDALPDKDRVQAFKQLAFDLGVSAAVISKRTGMPLAQVGAALTIAGSTTASKTIDALNLTLEEASVFAEFDTDEEALQRLTTAVTRRPGDLAHEASRIRQEREKEKALTALTVELEAEGWKVQRSATSYGIELPSGAVRVTELRPIDGKKKGAYLTRETASGYKGRVAVIAPGYGTPNVAFCLTGWAKQGLERMAGYSSAAGPLSDEEKARRAQKRADKAAMIAATEVRRAWIRDFLALKKHPSTDVWIAHAALGTKSALGFNQRDSRAHDLTVEMLGIELPKSTHGYAEARYGFAAYLDAHPAEAHRVTLAYAIALAEETAGDEKHARFGQNKELGPYLLQLQAWGYALSDVERALTEAA